MGVDSNYKKLLLQRNVLDTFRVYLEVTEDFLGKLRDAKILTADELMVVKVNKSIFLLMHKIHDITQFIFLRKEAETKALQHETL